MGGFRLKTTSGAFRGVIFAIVLGLFGGHNVMFLPSGLFFVGVVCDASAFDFVDFEGAFCFMLFRFHFVSFKRLLAFSLLHFQLFSLHNV